MDIKEIALRIGEEADEYADALLQSKGEYHPDWHTVRDEYFAEALIAEIAKQNVPCAFLHEWIEYHPFGDTFAGEPCSTITNDEKPFDSSDTVSPLFTFPPTAEQIANETAPKGERFLTTTKLSNGSFGQVGISHSFFCYEVNTRDWQIAGDDPCATHWMPLPTPPKRSMEGV